MSFKTKHFSYFTTRSWTLSCLKALFFSISSVNAVNATTIVEIPSRDGLIIAADKRLGLGRQRIVDNGNKIHIGGNTCVITSTGNVVSILPIEGRTGIIDINLILKQYTDEQISENDSLLAHDQRIKARLIATYQELSRRVPYNKIVTFLEGNHADTSAIFKINPNTKKYEAISYSIMIYPELKQDQIQITSQYFQAPMFEATHAIILGCETEKLAHAFAPYEYLKQEQWYQEYIETPRAARNVSQREALNAAMGFIKATNREHPELVGDTIDCLILTESGPKWLARNHKITEPIALELPQQEILLSLVALTAISLVVTSIFCGLKKLQSVKENQKEKEKKKVL